MPAEWEPHEATWLGWPHQLSDWPGKFAPIPWVYGEIVRKIDARRARAHPGARREARRRARAASYASVGVDLAPRRVLPLAHRPRLDARLRADLRRGDGAERAPSPASASTAGRSTRTGRTTTRTPRRAAAALGLPLARGRAPRPARRARRRRASTSTGGARCSPPRSACSIPRVQVRNPGFDAERLRERPARDPGRDATCSGSAGASPATTPTATWTTSPASWVRARSCSAGRRTRATRTTRPLEENRERLEGARLPDGSRLEVVPLPMPAPLVLRRPAPARQLRELLRRNAAVHRPHLQRPRRPRGPGRAGRAVPRPPGGRHPRGGPGVGPGHAALPDAAAAGERPVGRSVEASRDGQARAPSASEVLPTSAVTFLIWDDRSRFIFEDSALGLPVPRSRVSGGRDGFRDG